MTSITETLELALTAYNEIKISCEPNHDGTGTIYTVAIGDNDNRTTVQGENLAATILESARRWDVVNPY
jgi:hypothetical protein